MGGISGRRILVVGASSGMGRAIAVSLGKSGARVALTGRRLERLEEAAAEVGDGALPLAHDVREASSTEAVVARAADALGGLDALIYCAGIGRLVMLADAGADVWRETLETNLVGAALVTRAALPHLTAAGGKAIYLSSDSASLTPVRPGLATYIVSKAALDKLVDAWRAEEPGIGFTRLVLGPAVGDWPNNTEFANSWDPDLATRVVTGWIERGYMNGGLVALDDVTAMVERILVTAADLPTVALVPR